MINWKTSLIAVGALIALPLSTYAVQSHQEVNGIQESNQMRYFAQRIKHGKRGNKLDKLLQQVDLTPEQSQQVKAIKEESKTVAKELKQQMRSQHEEMKSLMVSDASTEEIRIQYQEGQSLRQEMGNNRFETMLRIRGVLTSEQRAEIAELIEQHRGRKSHHQ